MEDAPDLLARWSSAAMGIGANADPSLVRSVGQGLLTRWSQPTRRYHTVDHLAHVLEAIEDLIRPGSPDDRTDPGDPTDPDDARELHGTTADLVRVAAFYHDAVYEGRPRQDEADSADLAARELPALGVPARHTAEVVRLVLLTTDHNPAADDLPGTILCDADLAILAAPPQRYAAYADAVRQEYAHVPDDAFRFGRAAVLRALLDKQSGIYSSTAAARLNWQGAARANLRAELEALTSD